MTGIARKCPPLMPQHIEAQHVADLLTIQHKAIEALLQAEHSLAPNGMAAALKDAKAWVFLLGCLLANWYEVVPRARRE